MQHGRADELPEERQALELEGIRVAQHERHEGVGIGVAGVREARIDLERPVEREVRVEVGAAIAGVKADRHHDKRELARNRVVGRRHQARERTARDELSGGQ